MLQPFIHQISISPGGAPKLPVPRAIIPVAGRAGDTQDDTKHHGGPERAVCIHSLEIINRLRAEGRPIAPGTIGENLTISGLDWSRITPGARLQIEATAGEPVLLEVASYTDPCSTIRDSFSNVEFR